jgi:excisionase family DNA binding protein
MTKRLLTAEQVADLLQVHHLTVLKLIKKGKLKAVKLGRVYRIQPSAVDDFIEAYST